MDFNLPEELQVLKDTVRKFVDRELIPLERECRPEGEDMPEQYIKPLQENAKGSGLWLLDVPHEYGGAGLDLMSRCVIMEEVARTVAIPFRYAPIFGPEVRPVLFHCNEEQKPRFLLPVIRGEKRICFAQTEPDAGSDAGAIATNYRRDGDHYVIYGSKIFITNGGYKGTGVLFATHDKELKHKGVSAFIIDLQSPGVEILKNEKKMGIRGSYTTAFALDDVRVPVENLLGQEGQGFKIAMDTLNGGRIGIAAQALGIAEGSFERSLAYST